jgi:rod shape-determining protein MreD
MEGNAMKKLFAGFLFLLFILEGSVFQWLLPQAWGSTFIVIPQLVVSGMIAISLYLPRRYVLLLSFFFGLLHDVVYGPALGISAITLPLVAYGTYRMAAHVPPFQWVAGVLTAWGQLIYLILIYGWDRLFDFTDVPVVLAMWNYIIPSTLFNVIIGYPIFKVIHLIYQKKRNRSIIFDTILR